MADGPTNSQLDLSAGDDPYAPYSKKANELLDDAVSRRRYRGALELTRSGGRFLV